MRLVVLMLCVAVAGGCVQMAKVGPGDVVIRDRMSAKLESPWNRYESPHAGRAEIWTIDGLSLDRVDFYAGIAQGETLVEPKAGQDKALPRFRAKMEPQEIVEMVDASIALDGSVFRLDRLAPSRFADGDGFRFEFVHVRKVDELTLRGIGYGTVRDDRLYLVLFRAPRLYYFARNVAQFEEVARSVRIVR
ncbi:MAG: hypothetical protein H7125_09340 [Proteobacteria bacterium]|nr:hypothetical protein [Burkholderiales bacterium]